LIGGDDDIDAPHTTPRTKGEDEVVIQVIAVRTEGGDEARNVTYVNWTNPRDGQTGTYSVAEIVDLLENQDGGAYVNDGYRTIWIGIVQTPTTKYIRTFQDGAFTDDLMQLPRF
jgi:hypothetical protein